VMMGRNMKIMGAKLKILRLVNWVHIILQRKLMRVGQNIDTHLELPDADLLTRT
jgi:hypothetical protein